jgi:hypothetical protein
LIIFAAHAIKVKYMDRLETEKAPRNRNAALNSYETLASKISRNDRGATSRARASRAEKRIQERALLSPQGDPDGPTQAPCGDVVLQPSG